MWRYLTVLSLVVVVAGCTRAYTPEALGKHNLSKGECINIKNAQGNLENKDYTTQEVCAMIGGQFVPSEHRY